MPKVAVKHGRAKLPTSYEALIRQHMLRPIHDEVDYENAQRMIDAMTSIPARSAGQSEYLEAISILFAAYEAEHYAIDVSDLSPIDMLKHLMEQHDMNASDLGRLLGERSLGPKILSGVRDLSKSHIRKLADYFQVSADLFL